MERATENEWLLWFFQNADFGPADDDVRQYMEDRFKTETKMMPPEGFSYSDD